jgi:hypothetical protein
MEGGNGGRLLGVCSPTDLPTKRRAEASCRKPQIRKARNARGRPKQAADGLTATGMLIFTPAPLKRTAVGGVCGSACALPHGTAVHRQGRRVRHGARGRVPTWPRFLPRLPPGSAIHTIHPPRPSTEARPRNDPAARAGDAELQLQLQPGSNPASAQPRPSSGPAPAQLRPSSSYGTDRPQPRLWSSGATVRRCGGTAAGTGVSKGASGPVDDGATGRDGMAEMLVG